MSINVRNHVDDTVIKTIQRIPRQMTGWRKVRYNGKGYQLFGGYYTDYCIYLDNPIGKV